MATDTAIDDDRAGWNARESLALGSFLIGKLPKREPTDRFRAAFETGMQINGCARNRSMPEEFLHHPKICPAAEQLGRKGVSEGMRVRSPG